MTFVAAAAAAFGDTATFTDEVARPALAGRITSAESPLSSVSVYAYRLADLTLETVSTDSEGTFTFGQLPAGLYRIIAFKAGFVPAVVLLKRATSDLVQFLEVDMAEQMVDADGETSDFWSVRKRIPSDVLREIEALEQASFDEPDGDLLSDVALLSTALHAVTGVDSFADQDALYGGGNLGVEGQLGRTRVNFMGDYRFLEGSAFDSTASRESLGRTTTVAFDVAASDESMVSVTSLSNRLAGLYSDAPIDLERHQVSYSRPIGASSHSGITARYTTENNFYRSGTIDPAFAPESSTAWEVEGSYSSTTGRVSYEAGFGFRQFEDFTGPETYTPAGMLPRQKVDLFGRGDLAVQDSMLVEYGLYSTLRDGTVTLAPKGGLVLDFADGWKASTSMSRRVEDADAEQYLDFTPILYGEMNACQQAEEYCYQLVLARDLGDGEGLSFGAVHRKYGDALRLHFDENFFNQRESLYLVRGDELPELQFAMTSRVHPNVLARLQSSVASGGGGTLYTTDQASYENSVRYLVTSLDTRFERTSTGVFVAFHRLEQRLDPLGNRQRQAATQAMAMDRVQIMLSQDLDALIDMASNLALRLNMELSRGSLNQVQPDSELRKRVTGGIAVTF